MKIQNLRFQKLDAYKNSVFIAGKDEENFKTLSELAQKLHEKKYDTFLPIYSSVEFNYSTIRFTKNTKYTLIPNAKYEIEFTIRAAVKHERTYVNCVIKTLRMTEKPPEIDYGEELEL
jgi:hypothetical protein